jgi:hypothetical protein
LGIAISDDNPETVQIGADDPMIASGLGTRELVAQLALVVRDRALDLAQHVGGLPRLQVTTTSAGY